MEHVHSIILIKRGDKYLNYFDERWGMYLFPNIKGNDIEEIKNKYNTNNVKYLFDKVHEKYSIPNKETRTYHHYFYEVDKDINGEYRHNGTDFTKKQINIFCRARLCRILLYNKEN
mgnify:CR=1 FL=1